MKSKYDTNSNRGMLAIILLWLLIFTASKCCAQQTPMKFSCGKFDTIYVAISHDTIYDVHNLTVSCTKHNHTEWKSITFGFVDGTMLEVFQDGGWVITDPKLLGSVEFDYISFDEAYFSSACIQVRTKDYFIKYFSMVQK